SLPILTTAAPTAGDNVHSFHTALKAAVAPKSNASASIETIVIELVSDCGYRAHQRLPAAPTRSSLRFPNGIPSPAVTVTDSSVGVKSVCTMPSIEVTLVLPYSNLPYETSAPYAMPSPSRCEKPALNPPRRMSSTTKFWRLHRVP